MAVPQFKEIRRAYGFDEIAISPGTFTINPEMTSTDFSIDGITLATPVLGAGMDAVFSPRFAARMDQLGGMAVMIWIWRATETNGYLYSLIGITSCLLIGYAASLLMPSVQNDLENLTLHTLKKKEAADV